MNSDTCYQPGCNGRRLAKGLCKRHYQQQWATGSPAIKRPNPHGTPEERFWRYVTRGEADECWLWNGHKDKDGYGSLRVGRTNVRAHRFAHELLIGSIPADQVLRHRCNTPACVNPRHLVPGDHEENMADRKAAGNYLTGEAAPAAIYSDATVEAVRIAEGTYEEIGQRFGMSPSHVGNIKRGSQRQGYKR